MNKIKWVAGITACTMVLSVFSPESQNLYGMTNYVEACAEACAEAQEVDQTQNEKNTDVKTVISAYDAIKIDDLLEKGSFASSDAEVKLMAQKTIEGVMISGSSEKLRNATFSITKELDFGNNEARYFVLDALAQRKKKISLSFYLDSQTKSFATVSLPKQKRDGVWKIENNQYIDISAFKIIGKHRVTMKINTEETGDLSVVLKDLFFTESKLPMLSLNIDESKGYIGDMLAEKNHGTACYGDLSIQRMDGEKNATSSAVYAMDYIVGRGSREDWSADKKPFKIQLSKEADLLGMGKGKQWVLLAQKNDPTFLRTKLTSYLGEKLGIPYTPKCEFVDVSMNGRYLGSYVLCPEIGIDKNSIAIDQMDEDENSVSVTSGSAMTGGYLLSIGNDDMDGNEESFVTKKNIEFYIQSPSLTKPDNEAQLTYIKDYIRNAENAIYGKNFKDSEGHSYKEYLDMDSAVDFYLMNEMMNCRTIFNSSDTLLYKKRDGKLYFGPMIHYNNSEVWGATDEGNSEVTGFYLSRQKWFGRLLQDKSFKTCIEKRWNAYKEELQEVIKEGGVIDQWAAAVKTSNRADAAVKLCRLEHGANLIGDGWYGDDEGNDAEVSINESYDADVAHLKEWIKKRMSWIDRNIKDLKGTSTMITFMVGPKKELITLLNDGEMFYNILSFKPTKKGYQFVGWYTKVVENKKQIEIPFKSETPIIGDMTVYAKWRKLSNIPKATKIYFAKAKYYCHIGWNLKMVPVVAPFNAQDENMKWKSSDTTIATVDQKGNVETKRVGTVVITATLSNGKKTSCKLQVMNYNENMENATMHVAKKMTMVQGNYGFLQVATNRSEEEKFIYTSSNSFVVKVKDGLLYANKPGKAVISVYDEAICSVRTCTVTVKKKTTKKK